MPVFNDDDNILNEGISHLKEAIHIIEDFENWFKTMPDNENVKLILEKLDLNKSVFDESGDIEKMTKSA